MTMLFLVALPVFGVVLIHIALGRYNATRVLDDWKATLTPDNSRAVAEMDAHVSVERAVLEATVSGVRTAQGRAETAEVVRLLELAQDAIDEAAPDRSTRLKAMGRVCRMAAAIMPAPAIPWQQFRLRSTAGLAGLAGVAHHLLVSTHERFWLRLQVMRAVFVLAARAMRAAARIAPLRTADSIDLFERAADDWKSGDKEMVSSLRTLLASLAARPRGQAVEATPR